MRFNPGAFRKTLVLLQPTPQGRDEIGGKKTPVFTEVGRVRALERDKTVTHREVIGAYVTPETSYFIIRDVRRVWPINNSWRLMCDGCTYIINTVSVLDDQLPYYLELEATKIAQGGYPRTV